MMCKIDRADVAAGRSPLLDTELGFGLLPPGVSDAPGGWSNYIDMLRRPWQIRSWGDPDAFASTAVSDALLRMVKDPEDS